MSYHMPHQLWSRHLGGISVLSLLLIIAGCSGSNNTTSGTLDTLRLETPLGESGPSQRSFQNLDFVFLFNFPICFIFCNALTSRFLV